jgi:hypothetical protein
MPTFEKFAKKIPPHASDDKERCKGMTVFYGLFSKLKQKGGLQL